MRKKTLFKKAAVFVIIILLLVISINSSAGNLVPSVTNEENIYDTSRIISVNKRLCEHNAYIFGNGEDSSGLFEFILDYPGNLTCICEGGSLFFSGGTWTNDDFIVTSELYTGSLLKIDPETCEISVIGGGGVGLNGLSYDPTENVLYGCSSTDLYKINTETGYQELMGNFGGVSMMISIACDAGGELFGWDLVEDKLWTIDKETGQATEVGPLGINLNYAQDGHFCMDCDILYLAAYTTSPYEGCFLYECDEDTGSCTLIGPFEGNVTASLLAIPFNLNFNPPNTIISFDPSKPDGCNDYYVSNVTVTLNATDDSGVNATYYRINSVEWKEYVTPFLLTEDGNDILIEFYSVDDDGNIEDVKSEEISIDQTPPNASVEWDTVKDDGIWYVKFTVNATDETSGLDDRLEMYVNDGLLATVEGPGPEYVFEIEWSKQFKTAILGFKICDCACNCILLKVNGSDIKAFNSIQEKSIYLWQYYLFTRYSLIQETLGFFKCQKNLLH